MAHPTHTFERPNMSIRIMPSIFMPIRKAFTLALLLVLAASALPRTGAAQIISHGDLFGPGAPPPLFGIELGFGLHKQQGDYQADCHCDFPVGSGTGFMGSLVFELPLSYEWVIGLKGGIDFKNTVGMVTVVDAATVLFPNPVNGDSTTTTTIPLQRTGTVKMTYLTFAPFVQYQFFRLGPFIRAGLGVSLLVANHFTHQRTLNSTTIQLADGTTVPNVRFGNGTMDETLQDGPITDVSPLRLGALLGVGYDISLNDRAVIAPMFTYDLPLNVIRQTLATNWKISTIFGSIELKYRLN